MLKILETSIDDLIAVKAAGILTGSDYDDVFPVIGNAIKKYGKIRFFLIWMNSREWTSALF